MRAMLLGAGGMLGHDLVATVPAAVTLLPFARTEMDITNATALVAAVATFRPDVIVNAAAYTAVDRAESERDIAFSVNASAVAELGRIARSSGARLIHFSTDYVFDGSSTEPYREDSPTQPVNTYGASKLAGENALRQSGAESLIVRTQWLFGTRGKSFPRTMWERATASVKTKVVRDQTGRPTYSKHLAPAVWTLAMRRARGVLHVANNGTSTWFDVASQVFSRAGKLDLLSSCLTVEYPTAAARPHYSVLGTSHLDRELGGGLPEWVQAINHFLDCVARG